MMKLLCRLNKLKQLIYTTKVLKRNSALFINGAKATDTFTYVTPHIDLPERLQCEEKLQNDMKKRKLDIDVEELKNIWGFYNEMLQNRNELELKKADVGKKISELVNAKSDSQEIDKLKIHANLIKEKLKTLKVSLWAVEENTILRALKIPNALHDYTPTEIEVIHSFLNKPQNTKDHVSIGTAQDLIEFDKNTYCYLKDDAAIFELGAQFYFSQRLRDYDFVQFSNADFVKSVVVEGCGLDHTDPNSTFILQHNEDSKVNNDNRLHLAGGASLMSFFAYHTRHVIHKSAFPLRYFTMGRKYVPASEKGHGLFNVNQSAAVEVFLVAATEQDMTKLLDDLIEIYKQLYTEMGYNFRMSLLPADELCHWESARVSTEMFSSSTKEYVEVANISVSGDYLSKRLLLTYSENKQMKFPFVVSGTLLNVPRLLGCIMEQDSEFELPDKFKVENWSVT